MEYLEGVTLREVKEQSQTEEDKAIHARECFRQIHETLKILYAYGWFHIDLHDDQYIFSNGRWYLLDFGRIFRPTSPGYPETFPWARWQDLAWEMFPESVAFFEDDDSPGEVESLIDSLQTECEAAVHDTIPSLVTTPMDDMTTGALSPMSTDQECMAELDRFLHHDSKARPP